MSHSATGVIDLWLVQLENDPVEALEACRTTFQQSEATRNRRLYHAIAFLVRFVAALEASSADEETFRTHAFWAGSRRVRKSKRLSLLAVRYVLGARAAKGALYEQARSYAQVVEFFRKHRTDPAEIVSRLDRRGIYGVLDRLSGADRDERHASSASDEEDGDQPSSDDSASDSASEEQDSPSADEDSDAGSEADPAVDETSDAAARRKWWRGFVKHCREIYDRGDVPIVIAGRRSDLDDLNRRARHRDAVMSVSREHSAGEWATFTCQGVERPGGRDRDDKAGVAASPTRLYLPTPRAIGSASAALKVVGS